MGALVEAVGGVSVRVDPMLLPARSFDEACSQVLRYLAELIPMGGWLATRVVNGHLIVLAAQGGGLPMAVGQVVDFAHTPCAVMVSGQAAPIVADTATAPAYAACHIAPGVPVGAYAGLPVLAPDGSLFGTVCGIATGPAPEAIEVHRPLLSLLSALLSAVLVGDHAASAAQRLLESARVDADTDVLTGLLNRRGWDELLQQQNLTFRDTHHPALIMVIDLDHLKQVNDRHGHAEGDALLIRTAAVLENLRTRAAVARLGGDEFGILLTDSDPTDAEQVTAELAAALAGAGVDASIGHGVVQPGGDLIKAWAQADQHMYTRKRRRTPFGTRQPTSLMTI